MATKTNYDAKTMKLIRDEGFFIGKVEHYNSFSRKKQDLFGIIDYVAMGNGMIVGVQSTSYASKSAHRMAILESSVLPVWLRSGGKFLLVCWKKNAIKKSKKALAAIEDGEEVKERYSYSPEVFVAGFGPSGFVVLEPVIPFQQVDWLSVSLRTR